MVTEVLWPTTVKRCVRKFRAEGTLNPAAVALIERQYLATAGVISLLSAVLYFTDNATPALIVILLLPIGSWLEVRMLYYSNLAAYAEGVKRSVKVLRAIVGGFGVQSIVYEEVDGTKSNGHIELPGTPFIEVRGYPIIKKESLPKKGDVISIYQDARRQYRAMPDLDHLKRTYSLTTAIF